MQSISISAAIINSASLHMSVLDEFIAVVQRKAAETENGFARESLSELLSSLTEQRALYEGLAAPVAVAA